MKWWQFHLLAFLCIFVVTIYNLQHLHQHFYIISQFAYHDQIHGCFEVLLKASNCGLSLSIQKRRCSCSICCIPRVESKNPTCCEPMFMSFFKYFANNCEIHSTSIVVFNYHVVDVEGCKDGLILYILVVCRPWGFWRWGRASCLLMNNVNIALLMDLDILFALRF